MSYTINAGIYAEEYRFSNRSHIESVPHPETVKIFIGVASPSVRVGDVVSAGQLIASSEENYYHASISGHVEQIENNYILIRNDNSGNKVSLSPISKKLSEVSSEELIEIIKSSGIREGEPVHQKISDAVGKIDKIIINCCECEPFFTSVERLLIERPISVVNGVKILLKALGVKCAYIAVCDNQIEAISKLEETLQGSKMIFVKTVKPKYPIGDDRQLVYALLNREISLDRPIHDSGCIVFSAEICSAIYRAFITGEPYINRIITVGGDCVKKQKNIFVPMGTGIGDIVNFCGGLVREPRLLIEGGALNGEAKETPELYISENTKGILVLSEKLTSVKDPDAVCVRCGKCIDSCPMHLMPRYIVDYSRANKTEKLKKYDVESCTECGTCSYVCPVGIDTIKFIRDAKAALAEAGEKNTSSHEVSDE